MLTKYPTQMARSLLSLMMGEMFTRITLEPPTMKVLPSLLRLEIKPRPRKILMFMLLKMCGPIIYLLQPIQM